MLELNPSALNILCFDVTESFTRVAVADLSSRLLVQDEIATDPKEGPEAVLDQVSQVGRRLLASPDLARIPLGAVSVSLPARVDTTTGASVGWSVLAGWEGFSVSDYLADEFKVPTLVDNDVSLLLLAERDLRFRDTDHLLFIKVGTGVGGAILVNGELNRGHQGAAGDIGHISVPGFGDPLCRCGNRGCLEAISGGWALSERLAPSGREDALSENQLLEMIRSQDSEAMALIKDASRAIGVAAAMATNLLNPKVIVIAGDIAQATGHQMIASVTAEVYQRSLPLATQDLEITLSQLSDEGGLAGAALFAATSLLDPEWVDAVQIPAQTARLARSEGTKQ